MGSKDEWDIKEDPGNSGMAKGTSRAEVTSNSEKIKPIALAIVEKFLMILGKFTS